MRFLAKIVDSNRRFDCVVTLVFWLPFEGQGNIKIFAQRSRFRCHQSIATQRKANQTKPNQANAKQSKARNSIAKWMKMTPKHPVRSLEMLASSQDRNTKTWADFAFRLGTKLNVSKRFCDLEAKWGTTLAGNQFGINSNWLAAIENVSNGFKLEGQFGFE